MTRTTLTLLFTHLLNRGWKNERVKLKMFGEFSLNFTFGKDDCRKLDFARPNSDKAVFL